MCGLLAKVPENPLHTSEGRIWPSIVIVIYGIVKQSTKEAEWMWGQHSEGLQYKLSSMTVLRKKQMRNRESFNFLFPPRQCSCGSSLSTTYVLPDFQWTPNTLKAMGQILQNTVKFCRIVGACHLSQSNNSCAASSRLEGKTEGRQTANGLTKLIYKRMVRKICTPADQARCTDLGVMARGFVHRFVHLL